jgi:hypothetical protein
LLMIILQQKKNFYTLHPINLLIALSSTKDKQFDTLSNK